MAMTSMRQGPPEILKNIQLNADFINAPSLGVDDNIAYTAAQLNIAPAQAYGSSMSTRYSSFNLLILVQRLLYKLRWAILVGSILTTKTALPTIAT